MPQYCFAPECKTKGGHLFPLDEDMYLKWITAIKREDPDTKKLLEPSEDSVVCSLHFQNCDYSETLMKERKRLLPTAVPSVFPYRSSVGE